METIFRELYKTTSFASTATIKNIEPLPPAGSDRRYFRIFLSDESTLLASFNEDVEENETYFYFAEHFVEKGINVPKTYAIHNDRKHYLLEDVGDVSLFSLVAKSKGFTPELEAHYKQTLLGLLDVQLNGGKGLDYEKCYPIADFGKDVIGWDFNYFKYYFQRLTPVVVNEYKLEQDFQALTDYLLTADCNHFLYRDFQARNVHLFNGEPYFIDHQGGKKGAMQYDVVSLLYQAKANIPQDKREELTAFYLEEASKRMDIDQEQWMEHFYGYMLIRFLQTLGSYGYRGFYRRKEHFLASIPYQLKNIEWWLSEERIPVALPTLRNVLQQLVDSEELQQYGQKVTAPTTLEVTVNSFSYKIGGVPPDPTDNGGGYVFDCRWLHNPGRYDPYKTLTGRDEPVIAFLKNESKIDEFLMKAYSIVDPVVEKYIERNFTHLMVSFGCTGGQHRSVYSADRMAKHLEEKYGVKVNLTHIRQEEKNWVNEMY